MEDTEAQNDEILALQSIFDDSQIQMNTSDAQKAGCIFVKPEIIGGQLAVRADKNGHLVNTTLEHLCPIELHFNIPSDYPSVNPPDFTLVCKWLKRDQVKSISCKVASHLFFMFFISILLFS